MKLFTYMDHLNGTCKAHEIDQPWEPRWTSSDASLGLCDPDMVGQPKDAPPGDQQSDEDLQMSDDMFEHEMAAYRRNPQEYKARNPPALVVKLLAVAEDRAQKQKEQERQRKRKADYKTMNSEELQRALLQKLGLIPADED